MVLFKNTSLPFSTLGRIIRLTQEVIDYREWIIKKWGGRDVARTDNRGRGPQTWFQAVSILLQNSMFLRL